MTAKKLQWKRIAKGDELPCQSFLRKKNGEILKLSTVAGVTVGQDAYYLPVDDVIEEIKNYPIEENEDEKIKQELIEYHKAQAFLDGKPNNKHVKFVAWLEKQGDIPTDAVLDSNKDGLITDTIRCKIEKQGEQKSADKIEPKFHEGEWIIDKQGIVHQIANVIKNVTNHTYGYDTVGGGYFNDNTEGVRLWTIKDAKAGDVLSFNDGHGNDCIELIKSAKDKKIEFWFCLTNGNRYEVFDGAVPYTNFASREDATPATNEQRDLLFQKMREAGYEWDDDKKELKKIEQKPWSEEDERIINGLIDSLTRISFNTRTDSTSPNYTFYKEIDWLKSLKDRYTWKPSESHIFALESVIDSHPFANPRTKESLQDLVKQLKAL